MEEKSNATLEKIHEAAMAEFLDKGFQLSLIHIFVQPRIMAPPCSAAYT